MDQTLLLSHFVSTVTWIPFRTHTSAERGEVLDHKTVSRPTPTELYIPLH